MRGPGVAGRMDGGEWTFASCSRVGITPPGSTSFTATVPSHERDQTRLKEGNSLPTEPVSVNI